MKVTMATGTATVMFDLDLEKGEITYLSICVPRHEQQARAKLLVKKTITAPATQHRRLLEKIRSWGFDIEDKGDGVFISMLRDDHGDREDK